MNNKPVIRDERTDAVVGAGCRLAYRVLSSGVGIIFGVRALVFRQFCWDLFGLYIVGQGVLFVFASVKHVQAFSWRYARLGALIGGLVGLVLGLAMALLRRYF